MLLSFSIPAGMVLDGVVDTTSVVVDVISGAGVVVGAGFLQENSFIRSKTLKKTFLFCPNSIIFQISSYQNVLSDQSYLWPL